MKKEFFLSLILFFLCFTSISNAQTAAISPEKRAIIAEIIIITKADKNAAETMKTVSAQMNEAMPSIMKQILGEQKNLTAAQKAELEAELSEKSAEFSRRFDEKFLKAIDFQEFIEISSYPLYDKFFTEAELKDLLAFYKTSTGQKLNAVMPQLAGEAMRLSNEYLLPKINDVIAQLIKEDAEKLKKSPPAPKPKSEK